MRGPDDYRAVEQTAANVTAAANAAATVTVAAVEDEYWVLDTIDWSFDGTPASSITVTIGSIKWKIDVTQDADRLGHRSFPRGLTAKAYNTALLVTAAAAGTGVKGKINITYH